MGVRVPVNTDLQHLVPGYDPAKAHEHYMRTRHLKGREKAAKPPENLPRMRRGQESAKERQRKELQGHVKHLQNGLAQLDALIATREQEERAENRKGKAKKERAAKELTKPKIVVEKIQGQRALRHKAPDTTPKRPSVSELRSLATKVRGQIAVANQKLAAL